MSRSSWHQRILLILPEFPPQIGGMQTHAAYLSQYLAEKGYTIEVVTYRATNAVNSEEINNHDRQLIFPVHRNLSRIGFWYNIDILIQIAQRFRPDLIYGSTVFYGFLEQYISVPIVCRSVGNDVLRPWIAYPYRWGSYLVSHPQLEKFLNSMSNHVRHPEWLGMIFRRQRFRLMKQSAKMMSKILANSEFTANLLINVGVSSQRIKVVVGGVDVKRFQRPTINIQQCRQKLQLPSTQYIIMTACRLVAKKGINFLISALTKIRIIIPHVHLLIIGDGKYKKKYEQLSRELNVDQIVTFLGSIPQDEIYQYYWCSDLFILASRVYRDPLTGLEDAETMGRVLCEANAAETPIIASRSGGITSVITHQENGLLFEENNMHDFLKQIQLIWKNKPLIETLTQNGLKRAENQFDWSVVLQKHEDVFAKQNMFHSK